MKKVRISSYTLTKRKLQQRSRVTRQVRAAGGHRQNHCSGVKPRWMATALQIFDALEEVTAGLQPGSEFMLNSADRAGLFKLTESELMSRHLSRSRAQEIVYGFWHGNLDPLGRSLGVSLGFDDNAPLLLNSKNTTDGEAA